MLGISVLAALFLANSIWSDEYFHFLENKLGFQFNDVSFLKYSLHHWINDGLMSIFFFVVGLELKREIVAGELSNPRKALLPVGEALGGMCSRTTACSAIQRSLSEIGFCGKSGQYSGVAGQNWCRSFCGRENLLFSSTPCRAQQLTPGACHTRSQKYSPYCRPCSLRHAGQ